MSTPATKIDKSGVLYAIGAYSAWGFVPLFWRELKQFSSIQILAHRIVWSLVFFILIFLLRGRLSQWSKLLVQKDYLKKCIPSAIVIAVNWGLYIFAVNSGYALESSLGYFINPILNVVIGASIFHEKLNRRQWLAFSFALTGVTLLTLLTGRIPWVALALAGTFSAYGILRKTTKVQGTTGTAIESAVLLPVALGILFTPHFSPTSALEFEDPIVICTLLFLGGAVTAIPLTWFSEAAQRLPLSSLGFFQFISPTFQFLIAIFVFHESFGIQQFMAFALIWTALGIFIFDSAQRSRYARRVRSNPSI